MNKQEALSLIEDVIAYEMRHDEMYEPEGLVWDVEATRDRIFDDMVNDEMFTDHYNRLRDVWAQEEYAHMTILDWFSMHEPVFRQVENV